MEGYCYVSRMSRNMSPSRRRRRRQWGLGAMFYLRCYRPHLAFVDLETSPKANETNPPIIHLNDRKNSTPMKKIATPLEVAYQVLVMSSDVLSGHTTGQIVMVAGGMEGQPFMTRCIQSSEESL